MRGSFLLPLLCCPAGGIHAGCGVITISLCFRPVFTVLPPDCILCIGFLFHRPVLPSVLLSRTFLLSAALFSAGSELLGKVFQNQVSLILSQFPVRNVCIQFVFEVVEIPHAVRAFQGPVGVKRLFHSVLIHD